MHHLTKTLTALTMFAALILLPATWAVAGDLEPPSGPTSSMKTLQQIWDKLEVIDSKLNGQGGGGVPKTGQTTTYREGDDGYYQKGVAWPDPRFTDHGDGTVTDNFTGLMWSKDANHGKKNWNDSIDYCNNLIENGYSDWRLPNVRELYSLIDTQRATPAIAIGHPFLNIQDWDGRNTFYYWSSTTYHGGGNNAFVVRIDGGDISTSGFNKSEQHFVWPVREGQ